MIRLHPTVLRAHGRPFDQGQEIALHAFAGDVTPGRDVASLGNLVDFVNEDDAVVFHVFDGFARAFILVDEFRGFFIRVKFHHFLHRHAALFTVLLLHLFKKTLQLRFHVVHPLGGEYVESGSLRFHVRFHRLFVQTPGAQILTETASCRVFFGLDGVAVLISHVLRGRHEKVQDAFDRSVVRLLLHLLFFRFTHQLHAGFHQVLDDGFHVAADVAHFGEFRRFRLHEGRIRQFRESPGNFRLTDARGSDHENVFRGDFRMQRFGDAGTAPAVPERNGDGLFRRVLSHDVLIQFAHDFARRHHRFVRHVDSFSGQVKNYCALPITSQVTFWLV